MSHSRPDPANSYAAHQADASRGNAAPNPSDDTTFEELETYLDYHAAEQPTAKAPAAHHLKAGPLAMVETAFFSQHRCPDLVGEHLFSARANSAAAVSIADGPGLFAVGANGGPGCRPWCRGCCFRC